MLYSTHIEQAWQCLCTRRKHDPDSNDVWHLRYHQSTKIGEIIRTVRHNRFFLSPPERIRNKDGTCIQKQAAAKEK